MFAVENPTRPLMRLVTLVALVTLLAGCGAALQFRKANHLFEEGKYVEAVEHYRAASEAKPNGVRYRQQYLLKKREALEDLFARAERQQATGNLSDAEGLYQVALQIDPDSSVARNGLRDIARMRRHNQQLIRVDELIEKGDLQQAERLVRDVLAVTPDNPRANNSLERIQLANEALRQNADEGLSERFRKPVTLEFRDVPVKVVFDVLSQASGINFIYDQDIRPDLKVSVFLRETPLDEAIRMIGLSTQLETRVLNNNSMLVFPSTPQKISDYRQLSVRSFYLENADAAKVAETLKAILKTESIVVDEKLNLLIMRDSPDAIRIAEKLVALQDIGEPEVVLDVEILEIKRTALLDMGINLPKEIGFSLIDPAQAGGALTIDALRDIDSGGIYATIPSASIRLNDERSNARILANPRIRVKSKEKASILIGDRVPVITSTSTSTGFVSETVNYVDVGLKLEVEPSVYAGDEISIKISLEVSNLVRQITTQSGTLAYQIGTRNAQTVLRLKDGETQILAGLINNEDRKVASGLPFLSRFPVLSRIFGSKKTDTQSTEIVLSITPHLVRGIRRPDIELQQFETGTATHLRGAVVAQTGGATVEDETMAAPTIDLEQAGETIPQAESNVPAQSDQPSAELQAILDWSAPATVRAGEQFTAVLNISALQAIDQIPLMIGYDPKLLQVVSVEQGPFMAQGGSKSSMAKQVNLTEGKIMATITRQGSAISGQGALLQVTFKAMAAAEEARIKLLSAQPGPSAGPAKLADTVVQIE